MEELIESLRHIYVAKQIIENVIEQDEGACQCLPTEELEKVFVEIAEYIAMPK